MGAPHVDFTCGAFDPCRSKFSSVDLIDLDSMVRTPTRKIDAWAAKNVRTIEASTAGKYDEKSCGGGPLS